MAGFAGEWVALEQAGPENALEIDELDRRREFLPEMGGLVRRPSAPSPFSPIMVIRDKRTGRAIGTIESHDLPGYPGVSNMTLYTDATVARPGHALEALYLYIPGLFLRGTAVVHLEVISFNQNMLGQLERFGIPRLATLRSHKYVAGRFWDVHVLAFDEPGWRQMLAKLDAWYKKRGGRPAALGAAGGAAEA